ncbi:MAG TPA: glycosyltransferase [Thermoleophilaceae bacterium]
MAGTVDIGLVSLGTTPGLRHADAVLADQIRAAGATCEVAPVRIGGAVGALRRNPAATDLVESLAARHSARRLEARALIFSSVTAALLQRTPEVPWAVRFDSTASLNRPGWSGAWQRRREREVLERATLLLPWGDEAARVASGVVVRVPVEEIEPAAVRDIDAIAYGGYPRKRGLDVLCAAWARVARQGERLVIGGVDRARGVKWLDRCGVPEPPGVEWHGLVPREQWLSMVARSRVFVNASRREDHGLAQLEALSAGCALVTVPSPGPYEALPIARTLAPALVSEDLAGALRAGLDLEDPEGYAAHAREMLGPFRAGVVERVVASQVLPALGVR